jgi:hypothetical protein
MREVPNASPDYWLWLQPTRGAPIAPRWAGVTLKAQTAFYPVVTRERSSPPRLGARRAWQRRSLSTGIGSGGIPCLRWGALVSGAHYYGAKLSFPTRRRGEHRLVFAHASDQSSGVCSGLTRRARPCTVKSWLEGLLPGKAVNAHDTARNACALGFASGEAVAMARGGAAASSRAHRHLRKNVLGSKAGLQQFESRHHGVTPKCVAAWLGSSCTEQHGSLTSTGKRWKARPDLGAGVRGLRHRVLLIAQFNSAQRPKHRTQGTTRARCRARRRGAGKPSVPPANQRDNQP